MPFRLCLFAIVWGLLPAIGSTAEPTALLQRAREFLGTEAALNAIESVRYEGLLTSTETRGDGTTTTVQAQIEIIFQHPFQQRITARAEDKLEVTALDDYEGWQRVEDPADPTAWKLTLLGKEQIKRLRANTWENLSFYRGLEDRGGEVRDLGRTDLNGQPAHKVAFVHDPEIVFTRYFDPTTGQLLQTETEQGARIREDGEIIAGGVRFPARVITDTPLPDGGHRMVTVEFESVTVNETFPADHFRVPFMSAR